MRLALGALLLAACTEPGEPGPEVSCGAPSDRLAANQLDAVAGCTTFRGSIHVSDSDLVDARALAGLRVVEGSLTFFRNEQLVSLRGLEGLTSAGGFGFTHHPRLADVGALARLREVDGDLLIHVNDVLPRLDGLAGLATVTGDLQITSNPALPQVRAEALASAIAVGGVVDVSDNMPAR